MSILKRKGKIREWKQPTSVSPQQFMGIMRTRAFLVVALLLTVALLSVFVKLFFLQFVQHDDLKARAVKQQTRSTEVNAFRGTIYDRNGNALAVSATAETIFISPLEFLNYYKDRYGDDYEPYYEQWKGKVATTLGELLELEPENILKRMEKTSSQYEVLSRQVDKTAADAVRAFLNDADGDGEDDKNKDDDRIRGVYLVTDPKRYYPYGSLAAHVLGFVGSEGHGMYGLEATQNDALIGESGLSVTTKSNGGTNLLFQNEEYFDAKSGDDFVTTLDTTVQYYLEQGLQTLEEKYGTGKGAAGIVIDPNTGAILGMASYPNYDPNSPSALGSEALTQELESTLQQIMAGTYTDPEAEEGENAGIDLTTEEGAKSSPAYKRKLASLRQRQWSNRCVNQTYEPGSTFKMITLSTALEEGTVNLNTQFVCGGSTRVPGYPQVIKCSAKRGHGTENLTQATGNSCNPAYVSIGLSIGTKTYYKYLRDFGLLSPTGVELTAEAKGIAAQESAFTNLDLACYAFGQNINVTPLELITAQSAIINGGYLHTPYLVEQVLDYNGNVKSQHDNTPIRQVISESTSETVRGILEYVVSTGTGKNGQVAGYRIGGKTGTADKGNTGDVVVSFFCFAPADDPQVAMLMTLDTPSRSTGTYVSGGQMVAPVASGVMAEILPYLGIRSEVNETSDTTVPNVIGETLSAAKARLSEKGLNCRTVGNGSVVTDQTPAGGAIIPASSSVVLYCGEEKNDASVTVPNVVGLTATQANKKITDAGLIMKTTGATAGNSVFAISQSIEAGASVAAGTVVTVQFGDNSLLD